MPTEPADRKTPRYALKPGRPPHPPGTLLVVDELSRVILARGHERGQAELEELVRRVNAAEEGKVDLDSLRDRIARLEEEARRYYHADGSFDLLDSPEEVVRRRIEAAQRLEAIGPGSEPAPNGHRPDHPEEPACAASGPEPGAPAESVAPPSPPFETEHETYHSRLKSWISLGEAGHWVAIRGCEVGGIGPTEADARRLAEKRFGAGVPILVRRIEGEGKGAGLRDVGGCGG